MSMLVPREDEPSMLALTCSRQHEMHQWYLAFCKHQMTNTNNIDMVRVKYQKFMTSVWPGPCRGHFHAAAGTPPRLPHPAFPQIVYLSFAPSLMFLSPPSLYRLFPPTIYD